MNKIIYITILSLVVLISTTLSLSQSEVNEIIGKGKIIGETYDDGLPVCNVIKQLAGGCQLVNKKIACPTIAKCLSYFSFDNDDGLIINVPAGSYSGSDCPGTVTNTPIGGSISIISQNGPAIFNCGTNQFINITINNPTTIVISGLNFIGSPNSLNGCLEFTDNHQTNSALYFKNVTAVNCNSKNNPTIGGFLTAHNFDNIYFSNCNISGNTGLSSSVILAHYSTVTLYQSYFGNNQGYIGGVVSTYTVIVEESYFEYNSASSGGCINAIVSVFLNNSQFYYNSANDNGGVVLVQRQATLFIDNSSFQFNNAPLGGVASVDTGNTTIENSIFYMNKADANTFSRGLGGSVYLTSYLRNQSIFLNLFNCSFDWNVANTGGAIFIENVSLNATNTNFTSNLAYNNAGAIGLYTDDYYPREIKLINCILHDNFAYNDGGAIQIDQTYKQQIYLNLTGSIFDNNHADGYAGSIYFNTVYQFVGGVFTNSLSSESNSMTFYSKSLVDENVVYFENNLPEYTVPIFMEESFKYWKVFGARGSCPNGVATINENGVILTCQNL